MGSAFEWLGINWKKKIFSTSITREKINQMILLF